MDYRRNHMDNTIIINNSILLVFSKLINYGLLETIMKN